MILFQVDSEMSKRHPANLIVILLLFLIPANLAKAQTAGALCLSRHIVGMTSLPSDPGRIVIGESTAYITTHGQIMMFDVSNTTNPVYLGTADFPHINHIYSIQVQGNLLFFTYEIKSFEWGIIIVNVQDPSNPAVLSTTVSGTPGIGGFAVDGEKLFLHHLETIEILDISNPASPISIGSIDAPAGSYHLAFSGDVLFAAGQERFGPDVHMLDITDPSMPILIGSYETHGNPVSMAIENEKLYLNVTQAFDYTGLQIIDVSTPSTPQLIGIYQPGTSLGFAFINDDMIYLTAGSASGAVIQAIDVTSPSEPALLGEFAIPTSSSFAPIGHTGFVASALGLWVYDLSNPILETPLLAQFVTDQDHVRDVKTRGTISYLADSIGGFLVLDVSDPTNPLLLDSYNPGPPLSHIDVVGTTVFAASYSIAYAFDASDPSDISLLGMHDVDGQIHALCADGAMLMLSIGSNGLIQIIDMADPASPELIGEYTVGSTVNGIEVHESKAYLSAGSQGLQILDITDPTSPLPIGEYTEASIHIYDLDINAPLVFLAGHYMGVRIIDVSEPQSPMLLSTYESPENVYAVTHHDSMLFIGIDYLGMTILDVSNPTNPAFAGWTQYSGYHIEVDGTTAYLPAAYTGLSIIDLSDCADCDADLTMDGTFNFFDVAAFIAAFLQQDTNADFNTDGQWDFFDVSLFLTASSDCQ